jgi:hypothetical protein
MHANKEYLIPYKKTKLIISPLLASQWPFQNKSKIFAFICVHLRFQNFFLIAASLRCVHPMVSKFFFIVAIVACQVAPGNLLKR